MKGNDRRERVSSGPPPSRSWTLAGWGSMTRPRPSVSTSALPFAFRPLTSSAGLDLFGESVNPVPSSRDS